MKERVDIDRCVQENTAKNINQPHSKQLGFGWAPTTAEIKKSLSNSLTQQKFTDGFLSSLFANRNENEGARFLQNIIDKDSDLIFIKDREQRFQMVNASTAEVYGASHEQLINKKDQDFNPDSKQIEHFSSIDEEVLKSGKEKLVSAESVTDSNGTTRTYRTIKVPIINCEGVATHLLGIATDISAQYESLIFKRLLASTLDPVSKMLSLCSGDEFRQKPTEDKNGILVVDDDEAVREVTSEILAGAGYEIFTAADGYSGFAQFLEYSSSIRLVILDMAMPHIDGEELFRQIRKVAPWVPVVVCSGLQEKTVLKAITPDEFLGKPYDPKLLLKIVTKFLD